MYQESWLISSLNRNKRKLLFYKASDKAKSFTHFPLVQQDIYYDLSALLRGANTQLRYLSGCNSLLRSASRCKRPDTPSRLPAVGRRWVMVERLRPTSSFGVYATFGSSRTLLSTTMMFSGLSLLLLML